MTARGFADKAATVRRSKRLQKIAPAERKRLVLLMMEFRLHAARTPDCTSTPRAPGPTDGRPWLLGNSGSSGFRQTQPGGSTKLVAASALGSR